MSAFDALHRPPTELDPADLLPAPLAAVARDARAATLATCLLLKLLFLLVNVFATRLPACSALERLALLVWSFDVWNVWSLAQFVASGRLAWPLETSMLCHVTGYGVYSLVYMHLYKRQWDAAPAPAVGSALELGASGTGTETAARWGEEPACSPAEGGSQPREGSPPPETRRTAGSERFRREETTPNGSERINGQPDELDEVPPPRGNGHPWAAAAADGRCWAAASLQDGLGLAQVESRTSQSEAAGGRQAPPDWAAVGDDEEGKISSGVSSQEEREKSPGIVDGDKECYKPPEVRGDHNNHSKPPEGSKEDKHGKSPRGPDEGKKHSKTPEVSSDKEQGESGVAVDDKGKVKSLGAPDDDNDDYNQTVARKAKEHETPQEDIKKDKRHLEEHKGSPGPEDSKVPQAAASAPNGAEHT